MKYYITNFYRWEQPLIDAIRKNGFFVYGIRDCEGVHYSIEKRVLVNNIGFLVADSELATPLSDTQLEIIGKESLSLSDKIRVIADSIKDELALSKAKYELEEAEREMAWQEAIKIQNNRMERDRHYNLSLRKDNPVKFSNGYGITFQTIYNNGNGTQRVMYFITNPEGKIVVDSTEETFNLNARYNRMAKVIAQNHLIAV
jgi:hypothetical protein